MSSYQVVTQAWHEIGGTRRFYRSIWEANYAYYLQWLKVNGQIQSWEHEPVIFWFDGIRAGVTSYKPDFLVVESSGARKYHEVKGRMDAKSATKLKRMSKYHPGETIVLIDAAAYHSIRRSVSALVPGWQ